MKPRPQHSSHRQGSIYSIVLMNSLLISTIGLAALQLQRSQARTAADVGDFAEARIYARAAIDIGMLQIRNDPYWRTNLGNGSWISNRTMGNGRCSLTVSDPVDNDVTRGENHPVILTGIGMKGLATMCMSARLEVSPRLGSCLEVPMISGGKTSVSGTMLNADQTLSSNDHYSAGGGAIINANVEAVKSISGSTYNGSRLAKLQPRDMPDKLNALNYYLASGTTIRHTDLSLWSQHEMLTNTKFETDVSGWYATGGTCTIQQSSARAKDGTFSMLVSKRSAAAAVAAQDISLGLITRGNTYELLIPVFPSAACTAQAVLTITSTGSGMQTFATPAVTLQKNASGVFVWQDLWGYVKPIWTGTLTKATVSVSMSVKNNYFMDKVSMIDTSYPKGVYVMDRQLLSPSVNPFGSQQTNANGIYIVNCGGKDVVVGRMRIVGTLVFVNPGSNSDITGPVVWEPAIYNYPAVLSDNTINMTFDSSALSEEIFGVNLNPPGTPYPFIGGVSNATQTDTYPSRVTGLIYSKRDLKLKGAPVLSGVVITDRDLSIEGTICSMTYGNVYLNDPPPGFDVGSIEMKDVPGTWKRTVQ